jgi:hypothetical protein
MEGEFDYGDLDGCEVDFASDPIPDDDAAGWVLFADVASDPEAIAERKRAWLELFGSPTNSDGG